MSASHNEKARQVQPLRRQGNDALKGHDADERKKWRNVPDGGATAEFGGLLHMRQRAHGRLRSFL